MTSIKMFSRLWLVLCGLGFLSANSPSAQAQTGSFLDGSFSVGTRSKANRPTNYNDVAVGYQRAKKGNKTGAARSGFKISDNENPRPTDRILVGAGPSGGPHGRRTKQSKR